ncbi:hypothetical protein C8R44DRAFT_878911 [Mycena epipterygia]|nr:hypothetical protein C8R44DRAFT_878911 [Mycena epipterygia]
MRKRGKDKTRHLGPDPVSAPKGTPSGSQGQSSASLPSPPRARLPVERPRNRHRDVRERQSSDNSGNPRATAATTTQTRTTTTGPATMTQTGGTRILREKTRIGVDGSIRQERSVLQGSASDQLASNIVPNLWRGHEPVYDAYEAGDYGGMDDEEDDPLRQWAEDHSNQFLAELLRLEGRGDHREYHFCAVCTKSPGDHRCAHCLDGGRLLCASCMVDAHRYLPFQQIQHWQGSTFVRKMLKTMGLRIQLGHWYGPKRRCALPVPASGDDFVIVDTHGVHEVGLDYCGCGTGGLSMVQLLRARLYPATTTNPKSAATFAVLQSGAINEHHATQGREAEKEGVGSSVGGGRGYGFEEHEGQISRVFANDQAVAPSPNAEARWTWTRPGGDREYGAGRLRAAVPCMPPAGQEPASRLEGCAGGMTVSFLPTYSSRRILICPRFLYALFLAMDANFRLKRKDVSTEEKDPGLGDGWAFFGNVQKYMEHVKKWWNEKQDRSHCVAHDAVDKPDREARGTASSGIGAVDCARHNMKRPLAVGDLQLGERYVNMDYMFLRSGAGTELIRFFVSYDIACQWHINIWIRMLKYANEEIWIDGRGKFMTFLVPKFHLPAHIEACNLKFSFNLTRDVGQTDSEAQERGWADTNPLARSTKEMGPGSRRDTLNDHFNDWNHKKIIALGYMLRRKTQNAMPEMVATKNALGDMEESIGAARVAEYTAMAELWEKDGDEPNPFEMLRKDEHVAKVRWDLAVEAAAREVEGRLDPGDVRGDMHITELIGMGLQLEDQQRILAFDLAATGLHPTENQRRAMLERTTKLRRKIFAWIEVQEKFFPHLKRLREVEDDTRTRLAETQAVPGIKVSEIALWLPSSLARALGMDAREVPVRSDVQEHEYRLRVRQAGEALHEVRRLLLVRTQLYKLKDTHSRGVRANTRSGSKIDALNNQVRRAADQYRAARGALVTLGWVLKRREWEWSFLELKEEDVRGLPRATFSDPERQKGKKSKGKSRSKKAKIQKEARELSWIWISRGERYEPGDDRAMTEAVHIEWAKARARCGRWREEVDLLEEEMRRVQQFLEWRSDWWKGQVGLRGLAEGPQLEGESAYALRQAGLQSDLCARFIEEWEALPELIAQGRAGESAVVNEGSDREGSDTEESSDEEEEPIASVPERVLVTSYVDEVLAM